MSFGLQGDVPKRNLPVGARFDQSPGVGIFGIELGVLIAQHLLSIDAVNDLLVSAHFGFEPHPFIEGKGG